MIEECMVLSAYNNSWLIFCYLNTSSDDDVISTVSTTGKLESRVPHYTKMISPEV